MQKNKFNTSYIGKRDDVLSMIPKQAKTILDVGCSIGTLGQQIKERDGVFVVGIESDKEMAKQAEAVIDKVIAANIDEIDLNSALGEDNFDCIVCADILEHLKDPWGTLKQLTDCSNKPKWLANSNNNKNFRAKSHK